MTSAADSAILESLQRVESVLAEHRAETSARLERLENAVREQSRDSAGIFTLMKSIADDGGAAVRMVELQREVDRLAQLMVATEAFLEAHAPGEA